VDLCDRQTDRCFRTFKCDCLFFLLNWLYKDFLNHKSAVRLLGTEAQGTFFFWHLTSEPQGVNPFVIMLVFCAK